MLLSTSYLPPAWYFAHIAQTSRFTIEACEHFTKQTIRNRCHILSPNGIQALVVPVVHRGRSKTPIRDIRIAADLPWQRQHWRSMESAYRRSAYFEFYQDDLVPFYEKPFVFLLDYNTCLLLMLLTLLGMERDISLTSDYIPGAGNQDLRTLCDTGIPLEVGPSGEYPQVFGYKKGFVSGLSIADLIFNMGPASADYLRSMRIHSS
jgi:hypothetical protein